MAVLVELRSPSSDLGRAAFMWCSGPPPSRRCVAPVLRPSDGRRRSTFEMLFT